jgi:sigma-B regulation protein RsbU (phosphoserine phosphatase)
MKWEARSQIFRSMPLRSYLLFCAAVAFTFATVGVVNDLFDLAHSDRLHLILRILTTSGFSVLWVVALHRRTPKFIALLIAVQVAWMVATAHLFPLPHRNLSPSEWQMQAMFHGFLILVFVLFGYGWFGTFFQVESKRYFAAHTEIELASQIQKQLVPPIQLQTSTVEIFGFSQPSGTVGGDLVDAVESNGTVYAYVADVAGHGVAAGVMMSMVKTAVRMHLQTQTGSATRLLEALNDTLAPLTAPSAYATLASVLVGADPAVTYTVAAHLPILHYQRATHSIQRRTVENLPVAMFPGITYQSATFNFVPGDILAIVTDGLTEVFDAGQKELGDVYIEQALVGLAEQPLDVIAKSILETAHRFGKIVDDQTLLLLRRRSTN